MRLGNCAPRGLAIVAIMAGSAAGCGRGDGVAPARAALERALKTHGGLAALRQAGGVSVELYGKPGMIDQSRRADPARDREPSVVRILLDGANARWLWESTSHYPGLGAFGSRRVFSDTGGFEIDLLESGRGIEVMPVDAEVAARTRLEIGGFIPGLLLEQALSSPGGPSLVAQRRSPDGRIDVVRYTDDRGREVQLLIHAVTGSLVGYELHRPDPVWGDAFDSVAFAGLSRSGSLALPERRVEYTNGALVRDLVYRTCVGISTPDSLFAAPPGHPVRPAPV